jgi:hypothetical protein
VYSCTTGNNESSEKPIESNSDSTSISNVDSEATSINDETAALVMDTFKGEWFKIDYPRGFGVHPAGPSEVFNEYEFIATDEASFTSPDEEVQFFVYSPQWGGEPEKYLNPIKKEIVGEVKDAFDEIDSTRTYRWVTLEDKNVKYTRSIYSKKTETTHLIFSIKYKDQETYDEYKDQYSAFKKSLEQYAD